jgi:hypothetical protein
VWNLAQERDVLDRPLVQATPQGGRIGPVPGDRDPDRDGPCHPRRLDQRVESLGEADRAGVEDPQRPVFPRGWRRSPERTGLDRWSEACDLPGAGRLGLQGRP